MVILDKMEAQLRPAETDMAPYSAKFVTQANGDKFVVWQADRPDVPQLLESIKPLMTVEKDFYDIVAARMYSELLGWYRYRVKDEYCLVGTINGEIVGFVY